MGRSDAPGGGRGARSRRRAAAALLAALLGAAQAQPMPGKAQSCATCHGPRGLSSAPNTPNLAGQPDTYLAEQLKAFRSGRRVHEVMNVVAKALSDADIAELAAWYASIRVELKAGP